MYDCKRKKYPKQTKKTGPDILAYIRIKDNNLL